MFRRLLIPVCTALAIAESCITHAESLQSVPITDASGFSTPLSAAKVDIPASWRTQGGVVWNHATDCVNNKVGFEWRARSRDDLKGFEIMPGYSWQVAGTQIQMNPCPAQPFGSTRAFLEALVQQRRTGAQVLQYRDRPDLAAARVPQGGQQDNPQVRRKIEGGQILIAYSSNGTDFREVLDTVVVFTEIQGNVMGAAAMVFAYRAPNGQLNFAEGDHMAASFKFDGQWSNQMVAALRSAETRFSTGQSQAIAQWHAAEMARINAEGAADRAAIRAASNNEVSAINAQTQTNTAATNERIHKRTLEAVGEYNTYRDTDGTQVRSSIHDGERVLSDESGGVMSTDDPYFNPAGSHELERVR